MNKTKYIHESTWETKLEVTQITYKFSSIFLASCFACKLWNDSTLWHCQRPSEEEYDLKFPPRGTFILPGLLGLLLENSRMQIQSISFVLFPEETEFGGIIKAANQKLYQRLSVFKSPFIWKSRNERLNWKQRNTAKSRVLKPCGKITVNSTRFSTCKKQVFVELISFQKIGENYI